MKLIIVRHGEAGQAADDASRELTDQGRQDIGNMAGILKGTGWNFTEIVASPLVRTRQTAAIIDEVLGGPGANTAAWLAPGVNLAACLDEINARDPNDALIWVFHAPDVQRLAATLLGLSESSFYFSPGTMLALNMPVPRPEGRTMIVWKLQPNLLGG